MRRVGAKRLFDDTGPKMRCSLLLVIAFIGMAMTYPAVNPQIESPHDVPLMRFLHLISINSVDEEVSTDRKFELEPSRLKLQKTQGEEHGIWQYFLTKMGISVSRRSPTPGAQLAPLAHVPHKATEDSGLSSEDSTCSESDSEENIITL